MSRWSQSVFALLAFVAVAGHAETVDVIDELRPFPAPTVQMKQVDEAARAAFDAAVAEYDKQVEQNPYDVVDRLQRCRFIDQFIASYEYASFIDDVSEQQEQCRTELIEQHPDHPEVALWDLESTYGDQLLTKGAELLRQASMGTWTQGQMARLYATLARAADSSEKRELALDYALKALDMDEMSDVRLIAAAHLIARNDKQRALEILSAPVQADHSTDGYVLAKQMDLLARAGAHQQAIALYSQLKNVSNYDHTEVARILRAVGANDLVREELKLATEGGGSYTMKDEHDLFQFELEQGSAEQALAAYDAWRNSGWLQDPLGINRFALFVRDPQLPWQVRDITGLLGFFAALCAIALVCVVPVAGVHYRGLALRARTGEPYPTGGWRLRHAWIALTCLGIASLFALYSGGAIDVMGQNPSGWGIDASDEQLGRITLIESLLTIALLLPFALVPVARQSLSQGAQWSVLKYLLVAIAIGVAFRIPLLLAWVARPDSMQQLALDDALWKMIGGLRDQYGLLTALWVVAVSAPVVEEFVFRGILYRAFAAHIRPIWANVVQAALFSAMHMNLQAAFVLFLLGLVLGTLARRSGTLLAPMIMHAVFNLIAALILL